MCDEEITEGPSPSEKSDDKPQAKKTSNFEANMGGNPYEGDAANVDDTAA